MGAHGHSRAWDDEDSETANLLSGGDWLRDADGAQRFKSDMREALVFKLLKRRSSVRGGGGI